MDLCSIPEQGNSVQDFQVFEAIVCFFILVIILVPLKSKIFAKHC